MGRGINIWLVARGGNKENAKHAPLPCANYANKSHTKNALPSCFRVDKFLPVWWKSTVVTPRSPLQVLQVRRVVSLRHHGQSRGAVQRAPPFPAGPMSDALRFHFLRTAP
jgi:hypothetical protein